jgi:hypothetical protein
MQRLRACRNASTVLAQIADDLGEANAYGHAQQSDALRAARVPAQAANAPSPDMVSGEGAVLVPRAGPFSLAAAGNSWDRNPCLRTVATPRRAGPDLRGILRNFALRTKEGCECPAPCSAELSGRERSRALWMAWRRILSSPPAGGGGAHAGG